MNGIKSKDLIKNKQGLIISRYKFNIIEELFLNLYRLKGVDNKYVDLVKDLFLNKLFCLMNNNRLTLILTKDFNSIKLDLKSDEKKAKEVLELFLYGLNYLFSYYIDHITLVNFIILELKIG